ncbi:hypothetical protein [Siccibacter colletis]|uniref:hypothetical protein n=1 Tax=Siccibacter colletis TaxID=1505757 RepID=UPI003CE8D5C3
MGDVPQAAAWAADTLLAISNTGDRAINILFVKGDNLCVVDIDIDSAKLKKRGAGECPAKNRQVIFYFSCPRRGAVSGEQAACTFNGCSTSAWR